VDGRPYFTWSVTPRATLFDHVAVVNIGIKPLTLTVYATDAVNGADGSFTLLPRATRPTQAGSWIQLGLGSHGPTVTVPGRSSAVIPVRLLVPANASPGDHAGGIVASLSSVAKDKNGHRIKLDQRVGTRVFIRVSGPLHPQLAVTDVHTSYGGTLNPFGTGHTHLSYVVRNVGNVNLGARQEVNIKGLFGLTDDASGLAAIPLLLPGGSMHLTTDIAGVFPEISMHANIRLMPLAMVGAVDPPLHSFSASHHFWAIPWTLLALLAACVIAIGYAVRRSRRAAHGAHRKRSGRRVAGPRGATT
jgi:hypothetical protein